MQPNNYARRKISLIASSLIVASLLLLAVGYTAAKGAAKQDQLAFAPGPTVLTRLDPRTGQRYVAPPAAFLQNQLLPRAADSADIVVKFIGDDWTPESKAAFNFAAGIWETLISSTVPIVINAQFGPFSSGILGKAGPSTLTRDFPNAERTNTWYPIGTANKLARFDLDEDKDDVDATFSSTFTDWDFGTAGPPPKDKISFATVVLHEIGHGLGFTGSMRMDDGAGKVECKGTAGEACYGVDPEEYPMIFDRYTEDSDGASLLAYSNHSTELASQLTSDNIFFNSSGANFANDGNKVPLYAPLTWTVGSSYGHLSEVFSETNNALMTFKVASGDFIQNPGPVTLCMFDNMGWSVSEVCPVDGLEAANDSPTFLGATTHFSATITAGSNTNYAWDFGDGAVGSGRQVEHRYSSVGPYTAVVTATNSVSQQWISAKVQISDAEVYLPTALNGNE